MAGLPPSKKRVVALVLSLGLVLAVVLVAATQGLGTPGIPDDAVANVDGVDDGSVSRADYDRAMEQSSARLGLQETPPPTDPQYEQLNSETMQGLLLEIWAEGELEERGIEVNDADVQAQLDQISESFQNEKEFARVVRQSKFCTEEEIDADTPPIECADVVRQARLLALQQALSDEFAVNPQVTEEDIENFYEANIETFETPATRDVRVILNEDEAEVDSARKELEGASPEDDGYAQLWKQAARKSSQDQASKDRGGLLEGLVEGQGDPELDAEVFGAEPGELVGPFETSRGFYLVQVVDTSEASTQSLEEAGPAIEQQLLAARQQVEEQAVQNEFVEKWQSRTQCIEEVLMQFCDGYVEPEPEPIPGQPEQPEPPPVQAPAPIAPGTATFSIDGATQPGLPQRPKQVGDECATQEQIDEAGGAAAGVVEPCGPDDLATPDPAAGALPEGAIPVGPDGAPVTP